MLTIFADTDCDITLEDAKKYGFRLISMPYSYDGRTVFPYEDFEVFEPKPYYDMLRAGTLPTTSAISVEKYRAYFEPEFAAGKDIFYAHFSAELTMSFDNMKIAVDALLKEYPERRFYKLDTKAITVGACAIIKEIGDMFLAGATPEEVLAWGEREIGHFACYFFADDLKFFKRSGRVSGIAATMGTLLGVRPIIHINDEGKMVSIGKERGRSKALQRLLSYVEELEDDIYAHRVVIAHTDADEIVAEFVGMLRERYGEALRIECVLANPTAGAHCGPDSMGVSFHAKHR